MQMQDTSVLTGFRTIQLSKPRKQEEVLDYFAWVIAAHRCREAKVKDQAQAESIFADVKAKVWDYGVNPKYIKARQLNSLPEQIGGCGDSPSLPDLVGLQDGPRGVDLGRKMLRQKEIAKKAIEQVYSEGNDDRPSSLIHVTCAGYVSPSAAQDFVSERGWNDTGVTHSYHMGCYGAFPPVKMAAGYLAHSHDNARGFVEGRVDVVHTECLSLHGDYSTLEPGSIVNMTLFGDGFVKYTVMPKSKLEGRSGFEIVAQYETLIPESCDDMTWTPTGQIFEMFLSRSVPVRIKQNILPFVTRLCERAGIDFEREKKDLYFATHPGGPKILDHIQEALGVEESQMRWSRAILSELGNMSSSTIPQIWSAMLEEIPTGSRVVSMAFGPGLTATGLVLRKV